MIVRAWRGRAERARAHAYAEHFSETVAPELERIEGFAGAELLHREDGDAVEYLVLTRWTDMDAVRAFAGPDAERAVVEPAAVAALADFDRTVRHYEVVQVGRRPSSWRAQLFF
jgi:heme-degrading monooxygenase HmoA